jgi:hypothetical protein
MFGYGATIAWDGGATPLPAVMLLAGAGASVAILLVLLLLALPSSALRVVQWRLREPAPARAPLGTSLATQGTAERPDRSSGPASVLSGQSRRR